MRKLTLNAAMRAAAILRQTGLDDKLKKTLRDSKGYYPQYQRLYAAGRSMCNQGGVSGAV